MMALTEEECTVELWEQGDMLVLTQQLSIIYVTRISRPLILSLAEAGLAPFAHTQLGASPPNLNQKNYYIL